MVTPASEISPKTVDTGMGDYTAYKAAGGKGSKLVYLKQLRQNVSEFVLEQVKL